MSKALDGVRILDFTHVQSGPTCTQLLAWFGADVIKVEKAGEGDATRGQLRDIPGVDSLYFTMLNHNKRSITVNTKDPKGKEVLDRLIKTCDVLVENFAPGALDRMGFTWEHIQKLNPRMVVASVKGFGPGKYEDCKVYENVAQCAGGAASTTGFDDGPPMVTGAQIGDSGTGLHLALGIVAALYQRNTTGRGQKVLAPMQDSVLNLCRVKLRDQQRLDRMGFTWARIQELNPRMILASIKGFGPGPYEDCKVYENVAQCAGGSASTTGFDDGPPMVTGAQIGDSGSGLHLALGIVAALYQRNTTGKGQRVSVAMQDGVLNLCRVKLRDQQRLERRGVMEEYPQYPDSEFGDAVPRAGNASGGGQPGWILKCKGWESDPNAYIYFITQAPVWGSICDVIGKPLWKTDEAYATPKARLLHLKHIFDVIEQWTMRMTKFEAMDILNKYDIPCGPILSMKEIAADRSLYETGTLVEVDHPVRGKYVTVGNPIKLSDSSTEVTRSPLLGEHTDEVLGQLGYSGEEIERLRGERVI